MPKKKRSPTKRGATTRDFLAEAQAEVEAIAPSDQTSTEMDSTGRGTLTQKNKVDKFNGGTLNPGGTLGNKGGTGRPSKAFKIRLDSIGKRFLESGDAPAVAGNPNHPQWLGLGKWAVEMTEGKPTQRVEADAQVSIIVHRGS